MVALLRFLEHLQVRGEILLVTPDRAVDALEHRVVLVAAPVRPGNRHQLEGVWGDLPRVLHVRTPAQILEAGVPVGADDRRLAAFIAVLVDPTLSQTFDQLEFIGLPLEQLPRFISRHLAVFERKAAADDFAHPAFYLLEILRDEGLGAPLFVLAQVKVVVESVLDRRPNGDTLRPDRAPALPGPSRAQSYAACGATDLPRVRPRARARDLPLVTSSLGMNPGNKKAPAHWGEELAVPPNLRVSRRSAARHLW